MRMSIRHNTAPPGWRNERLARPPQRRRAGFPMLVVVVLFLAVGTAFAIRQAEVVRVKRRLQALRGEIQYYAALNASLAKQIEVLKSDEYIEKTARDKLGLVMPGEVQYMLVASKTQE